MPKLVMIRHGQSQWNLENRFTGWHDVDLTDQGRAEAKNSGKLLSELDVVFDQAFVSVLTRAIRTLWIALDEMDAMWLPQTTAWQLNERHYGALTGLNKAETAQKHGDDQVHIWRRSYDIPPPELSLDSKYHPRHDLRYRNIPSSELPSTESLKLTLDRVMPYWLEKIEPCLHSGQNIIIAAHGNSLRALCKHLFNVSDADIPSLEIPTGNPLLFDLNKDLVVDSARYLDSSRASELPG